jgi:L-iditol 2-dehydrogenase
MFTRLLQLQGVRVLATDLMPTRLKLAKEFGAKWAVNADDVAATFRLRKDVAAAFRLRSPEPKDLGATFKLRSQTRNPPPKRDLKVAATSHTSPLDAAIVAVPSDAVVRQALQLVRGGGQVLLFAHTKRTLTPALSHPMGEGDPAGARPGEGNPQLSTFNSQLDFASICLDEKDLIGSYSSDFTLQSEVARLVFSRRLDVRRLITHRFPLDQTAAAIALAANPTEDSLKIIVTL